MRLKLSKIFFIKLNFYSYSKKVFTMIKKVKLLRIKVFYTHVVRQKFILYQFPTYTNLLSLFDEQCDEVNRKYM